jgi:hypothetical protein
MRMVTFGCMVMTATIVASVWSLTHTTTLTLASPADGTAAMNPHDMMKNAAEMPVQVMVDLI